MSNRSCADCGRRAAWRVECQGIRTCTEDEDGQLLIDPGTTKAKFACTRHLSRICWQLGPERGPQQQELTVTDATGVFWDPVAKPFRHAARTEDPADHTGANAHQSLGVNDTVHRRR